MAAGSGCRSYMERGKASTLFFRGQLSPRARGAADLWRTVVVRAKVPAVRPTACGSTLARINAAMSRKKRNRADVRDCTGSLISFTFL